ncbi:MAG TPA: methionine adenosyltransferase [Candidatus Kapabacteria bacterium]|nr:methionine adenosyltransferase [Candidatus Kapabacteria bacterium]
MSRRFLFTSESVTEGHPDKVCDQISDAILDALLAADPASRVACETVANTGLVLITGEITSNAVVDYAQIARKKIAEIGYTFPELGFSDKTVSVQVALDRQSADISDGVNRVQHADADPLDSVGAGDQGMMFGYAVDETEELLPLPILLAHRLAEQLTRVRKNGTLPYLRPDGKTQVTIEYVDGRPVAIDTIVISTQHAAEINGTTDRATILEILARDLRTHVIDPVFDGATIRPTDATILHVNPSGTFVIGGPNGDAGLTGRKIVVDTYGGAAPHGGGAFSGKDPTKVDRSAAYAARYVAKNIVAAGLARRCEVQVSYAIGLSKPVSVCVDTFGTGAIGDNEIEALIASTFDLRPAAIQQQFRLRELPGDRNGRFYQDTAAYGHFGRPELDFPWERTDRADALRTAGAEAAAAA